MGFSRAKSRFPVRISSLKLAALGMNNVSIRALISIPVAMNTKYWYSFQPSVICATLLKMILKSSTWLQNHRARVRMVITKLPRKVISRINALRTKVSQTRR